MKNEKAKFSAKEKAACSFGIIFFLLLVLHLFIRLDIIGGSGDAAATDRSNPVEQDSETDAGASAGFSKDRLHRNDASDHDRILLDIFIMGLCPYGPPLVSALLDIAGRRPDLFRTEVLFIGEPGEDAFPDCPGGDDELAENLLQIGVRNVSLEAYAEYMRCLADGRAGGRTRLHKVIDEELLEAAESFSESPGAMTILAEHAELSSGLGVEYSPTLFIDGEEYIGSHSPDRVLSWLSLITDDEELARLYPPPVSFPVYLLVPSLSVIFDETGILEALSRLFPAASIMPFPWPATGPGSGSGHPGENTVLADAVAAAEISALPAIFFGEGLEKSSSFREISSRVEKTGEFHVDRMEDASIRVFLDKPRVEGSLTVFGAGLSPRFFGCLSVIDSLAGSGIPVPDYRVVYITSEYKGELYSKGGVSELEEDRRQIAIKRFFPEKFGRYLAARGKVHATSYWEEPLETAGLDPGEIKRLSMTEVVSRLLAEDGRECRKLGIAGDLALVAENSEIVFSPSRDRVIRLIKSMSGEVLPPEPPEETEKRCSSGKDGKS